MEDYFFIVIEIMTVTEFRYLIIMSRNFNYLTLHFLVVFSIEKIHQTLTK